MSKKVASIFGMEVAEELFDGLMSKDDKKKLNTVSPSANKYVHPNDTNTRHVTDAEKAIWNGKLSTTGGTVTGNVTYNGTNTYNKPIYATGGITLGAIGGKFNVDLIFESAYRNYFKEHANEDVFYMHHYSSGVLDSAPYYIYAKDGKMVITNLFLGRDIKFTDNDTRYAQGYIELFNDQPHIDFHFGNSGEDFTSRIISHARGALGYYGTWTGVSDRRKKKNITALDNRYLELLKDLKPVKYIYNYNIGYIAQDVQESIIKAGLDKDDLGIIIYNEKEDIFSLSYNDIEPINTYGIQYCLKKIEELEDRINQLENK